jgi:hypothetical protein
MFGDKMIKALSPDISEIEKEREKAGAMVGGKVIEGARSIINYAVQRLPNLVIDERGRVVRQDILNRIKTQHKSKYSEIYAEREKYIGMYHAKQINKQQLDGVLSQIHVPDITIFDTADALEFFVANRGFTFSDIDSGLNALPKHLKLITGFGLAAAKTVLKVNEGAFDQLKTYRHNLILHLINHSTTETAYVILKDRPNLLKFVSEYVLWKLGIPAAPKGYVVPELPADK